MIRKTKLDAVLDSIQMGLAVACTCLIFLPFIVGTVPRAEILPPDEINNFVVLKIEEESEITTQATLEPLEEPCEPMLIEEPMVEDAREYFDIPLDRELQDYIFDLCETAGVDPGIVVAIIERESKYDASAVGDGGRSFGLMQIQSKWHTGRMLDLGCSDLLDPYDNVTVGIDYLAELGQDGASLEWVLMAYNGGPSYANRKMNAGIVTDYAREVVTESVRLTENKSG